MRADPTEMPTRRDVIFGGVTATAEGILGINAPDGRENGFYSKVSGVDTLSKLAGCCHTNIAIFGRRLRAAAIFHD